MKRDTFFRFASPSILLMTLLMVVPLFMAIWLGMNFMTFTNINEPQFVGLQNYIDVLSDSRFWQSFRFTALYAAIVVPATILVGFSVALLLDQVSSFTRGIYMSIFLLPFIIVPIVGTLMFKQLFEPSGLFTYLYQTLLDTKFRYTEITVKTLIILYGVWYVAPFSFVVYFAGLQTLSKDQIEAASIDGATRWQKIRHIVIPHLQSLTILILLFSIMDTYRVFDSVFVLSELNPIYKADTVMTYTFQTAITVQRLGKANAMAILTVVGIMVVLIPNLIQAYREQIEER
ncbi:carbohydrate ABC transporter permease [Candidatus Leptofilum sp.]|uniref:carbohydrate ABC transporter permease n=1 Tax=Candidatus Leptofilum sp. TaxID=3241576 RepID=UPI003B59A6E4